VWHLHLETAVTGNHTVSCICNSWCRAKMIKVVIYFFPNFRNISQILSKLFRLKWKLFIACVFWKDEKCQNIYLRNKLVNKWCPVDNLIRQKDTWLEKGGDYVKRYMTYTVLCTGVKSPSKWTFLLLLSYAMSF